MKDIVLERVENQNQIDTLCSIAQRVWHETFDPILPDGQVDYMIDKFQSDHAVKDQMAHQNYRYYLAKLNGEYAGFVGFAPRYQGQEEHRIPALDKAALEDADLVMVTTAHTCVDYDFVAEHASLIFDTKNAMKNVKKRENIRVL